MLTLFLRRRKMTPEERAGDEIDTFSMIMMILETTVIICGIALLATA